MQVGIIGNYGHKNLGDEALLLGAIKSVITDAGLEPRNLVILTDSREDTEARFNSSLGRIRQLRRPYNGNLLRLPMVLVDIFRSLKNLDWLIFGGGGLLNDSNRTAIPLFSIVRFFAWLRGTKIAWWSVGIGPLESGFRIRLLRWLLGSSDFVTVRDHGSSVLAADMLGLNLPERPDLAHALRCTPQSVRTQHPLVVISVIPYGKHGLWFAPNKTQYDNYCNKMVGVIRNLLAANCDLKVQLIPVSLRQDEAAISDILESGGLGQEQRISVCHPESVDDLLADIGRATIVIATRLHSAILATLLEVPTVTIAYQQKVAGYIEELDGGLPCFDIEEFSCDDVVSATLNMLGDAGSCRERLRMINVERREALRATVAEWRKLS